MDNTRNFRWQLIYSMKIGEGNWESFVIMFRLARSFFAAPLSATTALIIKFIPCLLVVSERTSTLLMSATALLVESSFLVTVVVAKTSVSLLVLIFSWSRGLLFLITTGKFVTFRVWCNVVRLFSLDFEVLRTLALFRQVILRLLFAGFSHFYVV